MTTALLVIDVQKTLCTGPWAAHDIEGVIARINGVAAQARAAGAPVIFVQHEEDEDAMRFGSDGWALDERLAAHADDPRIRKTVGNAFHTPELPGLLASLGVERVVVCGLQSDFCIDASVRGALALGHPVTLLSDAHSTVDNGVLAAAQISAHHNATLANIGGFGVRVTLVPAADVLIAG
jgi:nicotinamidase-related amidase